MLVMPAGSKSRVDQMKLKHAITCLTVLAVLAPTSQAQTLLEDDIWRVYYQGQNRAENAGNSVLTCNIYWDNWVYAYGLDLISPEAEEGLPVNLRQSMSRIKRDKWLMNYQIELGVDQAIAVERINGPSNAATIADEDLDLTFHGDKRATERYFATLGECSKP